MKQKLSPVTAIAIVVVVVLVIGALGYFTFLKSKDGDGPAESEMGPEAMQQQMNDPAVQQMQREQEAGASGKSQFGFQ